MSENAEIIRAGYADFLSGNIEGVLSRFADEFTFTVAGAPEVPYAGTFRNRAELANFFRGLNEEVTMSLFDPREYFASGDRVIALGRYEGKVNRNGSPFAADWAMAWTVRDGRVVAMQELVDPSMLKAGFTA